MNKEQIIAFLEKWKWSKTDVADRMDMTYSCFSLKLRDKNGQRLTEANIAKLNTILKEMAGDLAGL